MNEVGSLFIYLYIAGICILFYCLINEGNKNVILRFIKGLSIVVGLVTAGTFIIMMSLYVLSTVFPNSQFLHGGPTRGEDNYQCEPDPLFGGC